MKQKSLSFLKLTATAGLFSAGIATASAGPIDWGDTLGECYNNVINHCNSTTEGYPNSCYTNTLGMCDNKHKNAMTQIPGTQVKAMKSASLRKAKRAPATARPASVKKYRSTN